MADDENIDLDQMEIIATNSCPSVILSEGNTVIKTEPHQVTGLCPEGFAHFHERSKLMNTVTMPHPTPSMEQNNEDISLCSTTDVGDSNVDRDQLVKTFNAGPSGSTIRFQNTTPSVEGSNMDRTPSGHQNYVDLIQSPTPIGKRIPLLTPNCMESNPQLLVYPNILIPLTDQESGSSSESDIGTNLGGGYGTGLSLHVKKESAQIFACDTLHQSTICDSASCNILPGLMKQEKSITIPCNSFPTTSDQNRLTEVRGPTVSEHESDSGNLSSIAEPEAENVSPRNRKAKRTLDKRKACHPVLVNSEPSIKTRLRSRTDCSGKGPGRNNHNVTTTLKKKGLLKTNSGQEVVTTSELDQSEVSKPKRQCAKNTWESQSGGRRSKTAKPKNVKDLQGLKNPTSVTGSVNLEQSTDFTSAQTVSSCTSMVDFPASKKQKSTRGSNVRDLSSGSEPILNKRRKRLSTTKGSALKNAKTGKLEIAPQDTSDLEQRRAPYTDQQRVSGVQQQQQQPAPIGYSWCKMMGKSLLAEFSCKNCKVSFSQKEIKRHVSKCTCKSTMKQTGNAKTTKPKLPDVEVFSKIIVSLDKNTREFHFECSVCGFSKLSRVHGVINHMLQHIEAKLFKCTECHRSYKTPSSLASHKISHTNKQSCYCKICGISFARPQAKRQHMVIHRRTSKDQMCKVCGKMFYDEIAAEFHKLVHSEKQFSCDICQRKFRRKGELINHKKLHAGKGLYACHLCTKQFSMQSSLNVHLKIHSGDLEFACHICSKRFAVRLHLKRHLAVHSDARPFKCHDCDRAFKVPDMLKCHLSVHSHPDTWPYRCDKCNRRFRLRPYLRYHKCKTN